MVPAANPAMPGNWQHLFPAIDPDNRKAVSTWLRDHGLLNGKNGWEFVCDYVYRAENGDPLFRVKRYRTQTGKTFVQERADGSGWIGGEGCMQGVKLVPYRLPEWKDSKMVCIVEGEKDADQSLGTWHSRHMQSGRSRQMATGIQFAICRKRGSHIPGQ